MYHYLCTVWNLSEISAGRFSGKSAILGALLKAHLKSTICKSLFLYMEECDRVSELLNLVQLFIVTVICQGLRD